MDNDGLSDRAFGHSGASGSFLVIDPARELVIGLGRSVRVFRQQADCGRRKQLTANRPSVAGGQVVGYRVRRPAAGSPGPVALTEVVTGGGTFHSRIVATSAILAAVPSSML